MKIKFDTATMTEAEARGLSAMLAAMFPVRVTISQTITGPGSAHETAIPGGRFDPRYPGVDFKEMARLANKTSEMEDRFNAPAPDGYPTEEEMRTAHQQLVRPASDRDTAGIPWDERIHASTKTTNKDGTWTRRRNTPDEVFDKVMAELKAANTAMTLEAAAGLTAPTSEPPQPTAAEAFTPPPSVVIPAHVPAPPVPVPPVPVAPAADDKAAEAVEIMKAVNAKTNDGRMGSDKLAEIMAQAGLDGLAKVFTAPIEARRIIAAELAAL